MRVLNSTYRHPTSFYILRVLVEAALAAINSNEFRKQEYQRWVLKLGGKKAIVFIAR
jgi:hypothetical protein